MRKYLAVILIISLMSTQAFGAVVRGGSSYEREQNTQWATKEEVMAWAKEIQRWFDKDADEELLYKVASRSELHGYRSENFYNNGGGR